MSSIIALKDKEMIVIADTQTTTSVSKNHLENSNFKIFRAKGAFFNW